MKKIELDFHGYTTNEAIHELENTLCDHINNNVVIKVITGKGKIREALKRYCNEYGLSWNYKFGNEGCLLIKVSQDI